MLSLSPFTKPKDVSDFATSIVSPENSAHVVVFQFPALSLEDNAGLSAYFVAFSSKMSDGRNSRHTLHMQILY